MALAPGTRLGSYELATRVTEQSGRAPFYVAVLGWAHAIAGREDLARAILAELGQRAKSEYVAPNFIAQIHAGLGEKGPAMDWFERAEEDGGPIRVMASFPLFDNLRDDARFQRMCRRLGIPV